MKNVPIKFRGKKIDSDEYVYGDLEHWHNGKIMIRRVKVDDNYHHTYNIAEVDSNSVAQLIGYDVNGEEVYEGDLVQNNFSYAVLLPCYKSLNSYTGKYDLRKFEPEDVSEWQIKLYKKEGAGNA